MDHFQRIRGTLHAEDVSLTAVAKAFGTPTYCYSRATLSRHVRVLQDSLAGLPAKLCYAVKANGNLAVLDVLNNLGCGFDAVSIGELWRVRQVGGAMSDTLLSGVGKTAEEIREGLSLGVLYVSAESIEEVRTIAEVAESIQAQARISLRINPEVDAKTHPYISTGMANNKFGVPQPMLPDILALIRAHPASLQLTGLSCHIGSQITTLTPFEDAARILARVCREVDAAGFALTHVGMGGGLGIPYRDETPPAPATYGACLRNILAPLGKTLVLEPGRVLVGNAGVLLSRVVRTKVHGERMFVMLDAGMNDLLRPALYGAHHAIEPVVARLHDSAPSPVHVVGPVCESADTFACDALLPPLQTGDIVALRSAGAYGFVMASQYNGRPKAAEVLCQGAEMHLVGRRERLDELWRLETIAPPMGLEPGVSPP